MGNRKPRIYRGLPAWWRAQPLPRGALKSPTNVPEPVFPGFSDILAPSKVRLESLTNFFVAKRPRTIRSSTSYRHDAHLLLFPAFFFEPALPAERRKPFAPHSLSKTIRPPWTCALSSCPTFANPSAFAIYSSELPLELEFP